MGTITLEDIIVLALMRGCMSENDVSTAVEVWGFEIDVADSLARLRDYGLVKVKGDKYCRTKDAEKLLKALKKFIG